MGEFIQIEVVPDAVGPGLAAQLTALCPVDIFALEGGRLAVRPNEEDECTLCELCLEAAPAGALSIHKRYRGERLEARGAHSG